MLLSEVFDQLTYGELNQLAIGGISEGAIEQSAYPQVISHINLALTELYKRFPLKLRTVTVQLDESIGTYYLDSSYSAVDGTASTLYLIDTVADRFVDNVFKIERVFDEDGDPLVFNDENDITSIMTYDYNAFTVPNPDSSEAITVEYRADHDPISPKELDPSEVTVKIPRSLLESLLNYIAYRAYSSNPPVDGTDRSGQYLAKFEASIARVKKLDLVNDIEKSNEKLVDRGWP